MARRSANVARAVRAEREIRASDAMHDQGAYKPPSVLDAPPPRPGMRQRWVRTHMLGQSDPAHVHKRFREGWSPRKMDTVPEGFMVPTLNHGQFNGCIGIEGLILCEMPVARVLQRNAYYAKKGQAAMGFVNNALNKVARDSLPLTLDIKSKTEVGASVSEDEEDE